MTSPIESARRARAAAASVAELFGGRLLGLPGTHLGAVAHPRRVLGALGEWDYWWQAHYLDALIDAAHREAADDRPAAARAWRGRADELLATIRYRNLGRFPNAYFDDMAWLALAAQRLGALRRDLGDGPSRTVEQAVQALGARLRDGHTDDLGGGLWWNTDRDFKNAPATAPAAVFFAREGDLDRAGRLVDWLYARLHDPDSGLIRDGIRLRDGVERLEPAIYTYNQGTTLGALLALPGEEPRRRAQALIEAVAGHLVAPAGSRVLIGHGGGDGGLFTGILVRYLALAARDEALPSGTRTLAAGLVTDTADAWWSARGQRVCQHAPVVVFPADPRGSAPTPVERLELSTQVQAWTVFEAAATLAADRR